LMLNKILRKARGFSSKSTRPPGISLWDLTV